MRTQFQVNFVYFCYSFQRFAIRCTVLARKDVFLLYMVSFFGGFFLQTHQWGHPTVAIDFLAIFKVSKPNLKSIPKYRRHNLTGWMFLATLPAVLHSTVCRFHSSGSNFFPLLHTQKICSISQNHRHLFWKQLSRGQMFM